MGKEAKKTVTKKPKDEAVKEMLKDTAAEVKPKEDGGNKKRGDTLPPPPPLPEEVEMRVYMHCEGCAKKVKKILKHFDGVEDVIADSKAQKVIVKGKKAAADPMKVVVHVQKKSRRKVELISPILSVPEEKKEEPELPKPVEKEPPMIVVVLKVHIHCEVCARWITKRILKMKGVQSAEPDINTSEVTVKGVFEEAKLPRYVYRRTGKHATIIKSELVAPPESVCGDDKGKDQGKKVEGGEVGNVDIEDAISVTGSNMYMYYPQFAFPSGYYPPPPPPGYFYQPVHQPLPYAEYVPHYQMMAPQIFSDENPNACSVM